mgnify:CR=1 FL=1
MVSKTQKIKITKFLFVFVFPLVLFLTIGSFAFSSFATTFESVRAVSGNGGIVYVGNNAIYNHTSGTMSGGTATKGGAVYVGGGGTFNLKGGTISGNSTTDAGGAIYVASGGTFNMSGGTITGNTGNDGTSAPIYVEAGGTLNLTGGTIANNTVKASYYCGGIDTANGANLTIDGATVNGGDGQSMWLRSLNTCRMYSGKVVGGVMSFSTIIEMKKGFVFQDSISFSSGGYLKIVDYDGTVPTMSMYFAAYSDGSTLVEFIGSSTKPSLDNLTISGYSTDKYFVSVETNSSGNWAAVLREKTIYFPKNWKNEIQSTDYMTTTVEERDISGIRFEKSAPSGYSQIGTLSTGIKVYRSTSNTSQIAFVHSETIYAPADSQSLFINAYANITSITFNNFNTSKATNMASFFMGCKFSTLDLSGFDTRNVTDFSNFVGSSNLTSITFGTNFKTTSATSFFYMFAMNSSLTSLDLTFFDTSNVTSMYYMFSGCTALKTLDVSSFNMSKVTSVSGMFNFGTSNRIETLKTPYKNTLAIDITTGSTLYNQATGDVVTSVPANTSASLTYTNVNPRKTLPNDWKTQVNSSTYMTTTKSTVTGIRFETTVPSGYTKVGTLSTGLAVYANGNNLAFVDSKKILAPADSSYLFSNNSSLTSISFSNFDTSTATTMARLFSGASGISSIDMSGLDTSNVTDMSYMFSTCTNLSSLTLTGINTAKVTRMSSMFSHCTALTSLNLNSFNTAKVTNMSIMFGYVTRLSTLDLSMFDTSAVTNMNQMFYQSTGIVSLDLSSFNMAKVTSYTNMLNFGSSSALKLLKTPTKNTAALPITCANSLYATAGGTRYTSVPASTSTSLALRAANTISFNYNGGSGSESSRTVLYGLTIGTLPSASQSGYTFNGWYTSSSGGSRFYSSTVVTQSQVLYAQWTENTPTPDPDPPTPPTPPDPDPPTPSGLGIEQAEYIIFTTRDNVPSGLDLNANYDYSSRTFFESGITPDVYTNDSGTQVAFVGRSGDLIAPADCSNMFAGMTFLKWVIFRNYDTYDVTNMSSMFEGCGNLEFVEMLSIQTPNVTSMNSMFKECSLLKQIAFAEFDCISLEDASYMFYNCSSLGNNPLYSGQIRTGEIIGSIPNIKYTYNLANAQYMFAGCGWDTFAMPYMFTNNLSNTNGMFENTNFIILDLSQFIAKASNMEDIWGSSSCNVEAIYTPRYCNPDTFINNSNYYLASGSEPDVFRHQGYTTVPFSLCFVRDDKINDYEQCTFHLTINGWSDDNLSEMIERLINYNVIFSGSRDIFSFSTYKPLDDVYYLLPMPIAEYAENGDEGNFAGWIRDDGTVDPNQSVDRFSDSDFFKRWGWMNSPIDPDVYLQSIVWSDTTAQCMGNSMGGTINVGGITPYNDFYNNDRYLLSLVRYLPSVHYSDGSIFTGWYFENSGDKIDYYTNITVGENADGIFAGGKSADSYEQYFSFPSGSSNFKANKTASEKEMQEILKLYNESKQTILIPEDKKVTITELKIDKIA